MVSCAGKIGSRATRDPCAIRARSARNRLTIHPRSARDPLASGTRSARDRNAIGARLARDPDALGARSVHAEVRVRIRSLKLVQKELLMQRDSRYPVIFLLVGAAPCALRACSNRAPIAHRSRADRAPIAPGWRADRGWIARGSRVDRAPIAGGSRADRRWIARRSCCLRFPKEVEDRRIQSSLSMSSRISDCINMGTTRPGAEAPIDSADDAQSIDAILCREP